MDSHVSGGITPLSLGELRQAILAVVVGNPLFSPAEQLNINHSAYEITSPAELAMLLRGLRLKDAERGTQARNLVARTQPKPGVCLDDQAQLAELHSLLKCAAVGSATRTAIFNVFTIDGLRPSSRLRLLGDGYVNALENLRSIPPHQGFEALYDN